MFLIDLYDCFCKFGSEGEMDLMSFVRQTLFDSVVRQLFGANNVPQTEAGMRELERKFVKFDQDFEYGTQLPEFIIRFVPYAIPIFPLLVYSHNSIKCRMASGCRIGIKKSSCKHTTRNSLCTDLHRPTMS